jgi:hypothetical protein
MHIVSFNPCHATPVLPLVLRKKIICQYPNVFFDVNSGSSMRSKDRFVAQRHLNPLRPTCCFYDTPLCCFFMSLQILPHLPENSAHAAHCFKKA